MVDSNYMDTSGIDRAGDEQVNKTAASNFTKNAPINGKLIIIYKFYLSDFVDRNK